MNAQRWTHMQSQDSSQRPPSHPPVYVQKLQSQLKTWLTGADPWVSRLGWRGAFWEAYASPLLHWGLRLLREVALLSSVWPRMRRSGAQWSLVNISRKSGFTVTTSRWAGYECQKVCPNGCLLSLFALVLLDLTFSSLFIKHWTDKKFSIHSTAGNIVT